MEASAEAAFVKTSSLCVGNLAH